VKEGVRDVSCRLHPGRKLNRGIKGGGGFEDDFVAYRVVAALMKRAGMRFFS